MLWGEDGITIQMADGSPRSVPMNWTDAIPADAYTTVGGGRSRFRVEDLLALAELIAGNGRRRGRRSGCVKRITSTMSLLFRPPIGALAY
jgi:hypothetical protein